MEFTGLNKIGLTDGEIRVYLALLDLGESTKTALAKKSSVAPSNIYDITNRLLEKGLISRVEKNGIAHFSAANPINLLDFLKQKEEEIENEKNALTSLLPSLMLKFSKTEKSANVEVFLGWRGLKIIFEDMIRTCDKNDENFIFGASKGYNVNKYNLFFLKYSILREKKKIKTKILFNENIKEEKERIEFFEKSKNYEIKFLEQVTPVEIMLYKDISCILVLTREPLIIRVTHKDVFSSFKQQFDQLWKIARK